MARKPKDRSAFFNEARELRREYPKQTANAIGDMMQRRYPAEKGLGQAVRKQLCKEELEAASSDRFDSATSPPAHHRAARGESEQAKIMRAVVEQSRIYQIAAGAAGDMALRKRILDQQLAAWEVLRRDPRYKFLFEDD